ncbi:MAG: hypothetical protein ABL308_01195 [Oceanicaulis sp.]
MTALARAASVLPFPRQAPSPGPVADWLTGQERVVTAWIDRLVAEDGDVRLIALLDQHAAFLREARDTAAAAR